METPISSKVYASAAAGAIAVILVWIIGLFDVDVPAEVAAAITTVLSAVGAWLIRDKLRDAGQAAIDAGNIPPTE